MKGCKMVSLTVKFELHENTSLGNWKRFKNDEKLFLFPLSSSFRPQDIKVLSRLFDHMEKRLY